MYLLLTHARLFLYNQSVFFRTFQLYTITVKTSFAIGETWRFLYDIDSMDVRCMVLLTGGLTFSEFTYKFWYLFAVINWCSHYDVLMSAFSSTTDHLLWSTHCWVMNNFGHVWASVKMPSKCHVPSPVWSVRRKKKWIKSIDCTLMSHGKSENSLLGLPRGNHLFFNDLLLLK